MKRILYLFRQNQQGQGLVEAALIVPILLIIMIGVIEVSHLAITQNRLNTAARAGARFGANGGEDAGILQTHIWAITNTLPLDEAVWDIWVIRGNVDELRLIPPDEFSFTHVYGLGETQRFTDTNTVTFTNQLRLQIEEQLQLDVDNDPSGDSSGLRFVGVYSLHDVQTILGLDVIPDLVGLQTMRGYSVMRRAAVSAAVEQTTGCRGVFPIIVEQGVRTITQAEYDVIYPNFTYPTGFNRPTWNEFVRQPPAGTTVSLLDGIEGMVYKLNFDPDGFTPQSFNWLKWNTYLTGLSSGNILATSLGWPGNSDDYDNHGDLPNAAPPDWPHTYRGYAEVSNPTDKQLHGGDFVIEDNVSGSFGGLNVQTALQNHVNEERVLRMVLWDHSSLTSGGVQYQVSGFAIFRILGYSSNNWILLQLIRIDNSCGQTIG